jgi:hypothetical protein
VAAHALLLHVESSLTLANCLQVPPRLAGSGGYAFAMNSVPQTRPYVVAGMIAQLCDNHSG